MKKSAVRKMRKKDRAGEPHLEMVFEEAASFSINNRTSGALPVRQYLISMN